jgi:hypothetical protein
MLTLKSWKHLLNKIFSVCLFCARPWKENVKQCTHDPCPHLTVKDTER